MLRTISACDMPRPVDGSPRMREKKAETMDAFDDDHVASLSEVDQKIMRFWLMLNATRQQLGFLEYDLARIFGQQEKQSRKLGKEDSAIVLSKSGSKHSLGEDDKTDDNIPGLRVVNVKLSASAGNPNICPAESSKAACTPKNKPLKSLLEGVPHIPNAPRMPSLKDLDESGEAKTPSVGPDGAATLTSTAEDKRERAILFACVRDDGLNHFISKEEIKAIKARGIGLLAVVEPPKEKRSLRQKLRLSRRRHL